MRSEFAALLRGAPTITALVPAGNINWRERHQSAALPGIVLHLINAGDLYTLSDVTDLAEVRVQIDVWAEDYDAATAAAEAVRTLLSGYQGGPFYQIRVSEGDARARISAEIGDPPGVTLDASFLYRRS